MKGGDKHHMTNTENVRLPYEKPAVSSHTEAELLASMEVWGASSTPYTATA